MVEEYIREKLKILKSIDTDGEFYANYHDGRIDALEEILTYLEEIKNNERLRSVAKQSKRVGRRDDES